MEFSDIRHRNLNDWPMDLGYGDELESYTEFTRSEFENLFFSSNIYNTTSPDGDPVYGSMRDYFSDMSQSAFSLTGTVLNQNQPGTNVPLWVVLPNTKMYYHNQDYAGYFDQFKTAVLSAAQSQQGIIPVLDATHKLCILYAGNMYADGQLHPATSGHVFIGSERFKYPPSGIPRNSEVNAATFTHIGVHCHEFGHILGLGDQYYYPYTYGLWGLMGNGGNKGGNSDNLRGNNPAPIVPKQRYDLGWLTFQNVDSKMLNAQVPYALNTVYKIKGSYSSEYILVENRQTGSGWNRFLPPGGLLVWRIYGSTVDLIEAVSRAASQGANDSDPFPGSGNVRTVSDFTFSSNCKFISGANSNVLIQNISNSSSTMTADLSPYWYGNISQPQTWSGTVLVCSSVTLTVNPGAILRFASGTSLTVNGALNAVGTPSQPITMTPTGGTSPGSWGSLTFDGSNSHGTVSHVNMQYGTEIVVRNGAGVSINNNIISKNNYGITVLECSSFLRPG